MIFEIAELTIDREDADAFEDRVNECAPLFRGAPGCRSFALERVIEVPGHYRLVVGWKSVDDHMITFRGSADFQKWREAVGSYLQSAPVVYHVKRVLNPFG